MSERELPEWRPFDSLRSIYALGRQALAGFIDRVDERYANALNGDDDE